jgi:hypothetical protein
MRSAVVLCCVFSLVTASARAEPLSVPFTAFTTTPGAQISDVASAGDVNGDGADDVVIAEPSGSDPSVGGTAYVVFGPFAAGQSVDLSRLGDRGFVIRGEPDQQTAAASVAGPGDVNGDGFDDVLIGAPGYFDPVGRAYVVFGRADPRAVELRTLGRDGMTLVGRRHRILPDQFGQWVAGLGDVDEDGLADVGIVATGNSRDSARPPRTRRGSAYIVFGRRRGGSIAMARLGRGGFRVRGTSWVSAMSSAGDWNADGRSEIAVAGQHRGASEVWIIRAGRHRRPVDPSHLGRRGTVVRAPPGARVETIAGGHDFDADGHPDLVLGTPGAHRDPPDPIGSAGGGAWLVRGGPARSPLDLSRPGERAWELARGDPLSASFPTPFAGADVALGPIDHDDRADVAMSAGHGLAVVRGTPARVTHPLSALAPDAGFLLDTSDFGGMSVVAIAGDMDGDGHGDLLAVVPAMPDPTPGASLSATAVYLMFPARR